MLKSNHLASTVVWKFFRTRSRGQIIQTTMICPYPVRGTSDKPPTVTVPLGLSQGSTSSAGGGSGADQRSLQQKLQRLIESVDKIER